MFINPYRFTNLTPKLRDSMLDKSGILKYKRVIYLSDESYQDADPNNFFSRNIKRVVILINLSKHKTNYDSIKVLKSVYVFRCYRDIYTEDNFNDMTLHLDRMLTTGYEMVNNTRIDLGITLSEGFSQDYQYPTSININDLFNESIEIEDKETLDLIDPRFYTVKHQELFTGEDYVTLPQSNKISWKGEELIDLNTEIFKVENKNQYEQLYRMQGDSELVPTSVDKNYKILEHKMYVEDIPLRLFVISQMSFLSAYQLHWDSKFGGYNIVDVYRPKDFLTDEKVIEDTRMIGKIITKIGNKLKKIYGDIRIMYYFSQFEERITVIFDNDNVSQITMRLSKDNLFERVLVASDQETYANLISNFYLSRGYSGDLIESFV